MSGREFYWERVADRTGGFKRPPGEELAALRRGIGREAGSVAELWPYYTRLNREGQLTPSIRAEHLVLGLYGLHQQGQNSSAHLPDLPLGRALAVLRDSGRHSAEAVDRRFVAAATAESVEELAVHLRSLVRLLKTLPKPQPFDYTLLFDDLVRWQKPERVGGVRRHWGAAFYWHDSAKQNTSSNTKEPR